ncbi:rod shape-determining protein MreC [bacterium]|nr:MAG: rod shape-determining protein MreC [bacterium]
MQGSFAKAGRLDPVSYGLRSFVSVLSSPLNATFDSGSDVTRRFREGDRLVVENDALRTRLHAMALYEEQIGLLQDEIQNLRALSNLKRLPGHERVLADVVGFAQYEGRITLSVGKEKGILPNMPVISSDGLVAIVQTVWNGGCQAALITNVGVQVGGLDLSRKPPTEGILKGRDPSTLVLTFFDPNAPAKEGDTIVTSGHSDRIPRMLRVGKILTIEDDVDYGIRRANVVPFMNPGTLKEVQILK